MTQRKRSSVQQDQEEKSRKQFGEFITAHNWKITDIIPDLGEDFLIRIFENGISTGLSLYVQLKSVQAIDRFRLKLGKIAYGFDVTDLEHWENQVPPVLLVVWDVNVRQGWYVWTDDAVKQLDINNIDWRSKNRVQVHIPLGNFLDENGLKQIRLALADRFFLFQVKDKVFDIHAKFDFPHTPDGDAKRAEYKRYLAAGDEVEINGRYIAELKMPNIWRQYFGEIDPKSMSVRLGSIQSNMILPVHLDFISSSYGQERVPNVELITVKEGLEELTVSNEHQKIPIKIRIIFHKLKDMARFTFHSNFKNVDAITARQVIKIEQILASSGEIRISVIGTDMTHTVPITQGLIQPPDINVVEFVDNLVTIQEKFGGVINFGADGSYSFGDVQAAKKLVSILRTGTYRERKGDIAIALKKPAIEIIREVIKIRDQIRIRAVLRDSFIKLMSDQIMLGPMSQIITGKCEMSVDYLAAWLESADEGEYLEVHLGDVEIYEEFENWLKTHAFPESIA